MLRYPCLVLDHDDTVVQSETTINYPYFCYILDQFRPGATITLDEYTQGCFHLGFSEMCRQKYGFTEQELIDEYKGWKDYIRSHIPAPYPGIDRIIKRDYKAHFGITPDAIYGWDYPEHQRKPNPYPLEQIMAKYQLTAEQILVVDDLKPAWEMASKVGVPIAFAAWGKLDFPAITEEMQQLCTYSFYSTKELERFLFD